ncbi:MAG: flagellar basal body P-ring formation protein FlgA [Proteobacteria bacterium]|nr:flagellar basal body P-ring formation protein FlgA [Pseudomonadota bacterium]
MKGSIAMMGEFVRRAALALLVCLAGTLVINTAHSQSNPQLREQIKVYAALVTLGDLFENADDMSAIPVFRSPELGTSGVVAASRVEDAARQNGLDWRNPGHIREVEVLRPGRLISLDEIRQLIVEQTTGEGEEEAWTVSLNRRAKPFHIDPRIKAPIHIKQFDFNRRTGKFRAVFSIPESQQPVRNKVFSGRAFPSVMAIVPTRAIQRGDIIVSEDLKIMHLPRSRVATSAIDDIESAVGMAARYRLVEGRPIRISDIEKPKLVKRNDSVIIIYKSPGLSLKSRGRALADGTRGQSVSVLNIQSKRTIEANVTGPGIVTVSSLAGSARSAGSGRGGRNSYVIR